MKIISAVSGSSGFIGSHLLEKLKSMGHQIKRIDRDGYFEG